MSLNWNKHTEGFFYILPNLSFITEIISKDCYSWLKFFLPSLGIISFVCIFHQFKWLISTYVLTEVLDRHRLPLIVSAHRILSMRKQKKQQLHELEKIYPQNDSTIKWVKRNHNFTTNAKLVGAILKSTWEWKTNKNPSHIKCQPVCWGNSRPAYR